jgi:hypothetical protein
MRTTVLSLIGGLMLSVVLALMGVVIFAALVVSGDDER